MLAIALLLVAALFAALTLLRVGGARRAWLMRYWPSALLGLAAVMSAARGALSLALVFAGAAAVSWWLTKNKRAPTPAAPVGDAEARAILGVGPDATVQEIRAAYRAKMAAAHPDRGGSHERAARLTAARDRLLKR